EVLRDVPYAPRYRIVRVNGAATEWGRDDLATFAGHPGVDAILLPKVDGPGDLVAPGTKPLWAMMETPLAMLNAGAIAAHPRLEGMVMGTNDLAKDMGLRPRADRMPLMTGLGLCLIAARAHGRVIVDGVFNAFRDEAGLMAECEQGRDMGFDGKTLIHPAQLAIANAAFAPSPEELALAARQIAAFAEAAAAGRGVAVLDGRIVENLHVAAAKATLERARAIAAMAD
ncbi:MAG: HpcH/HpaI aldolase/citrate lyase family protein, partial [Paracoccaceae bacterium]